MTDVCAAAWKRHNISDHSQILDGQGKWSLSPDDAFVDLAGSWKAGNSLPSGNDSLNIPFAWGGWSGTVILTKTFNVPEKYKNRHWKLVVDGAAQSVTVALNGTNLESRRGDNTSFQIELIPRHLKFGNTPNTITLRVSNHLQIDGPPPLKGSIYSRLRYGGIFGGVYLVGSPYLSVSDVRAEIIYQNPESHELDSPFPGQDIRIRVTGEFLLDSRGQGKTWSIERGYLVRLKLFNPSGALISEHNSLINFPAKGYVKKDFIFQPEEIDFWGIARNNTLYELEMEISDGQSKHSMKTAFGIPRFKHGMDWSTTDRDKKLKFVSYYTSDPSYGPVLPAKVLDADIALLGELGVDGIRIMQGCADRNLLRKCDEKGLLVLEELPVFQVPDRILNSDEFIQSASAQFAEMIRRDSRFTCIAGWGIGAEINPPGDGNIRYYENLTALARNLDHRPVFASIPFSTDVSATPLDFVILELTPYSEWTGMSLPNNLKTDRKAFVGSIRRMILPGNFGGWEDETSEAGQAQYMISRLQEIQSADWCGGVIVGDFIDWSGMIPTIGGPLRGSSNLYTTGLINVNRQTRPVFRKLKEYWTNRVFIPLSPGSQASSNPAVLILLGFILIFVLVYSVRQNNIFKANLLRAITSPRGFFQDIGDLRYFQTGHTLLLTVLISGGFGLVAASWMFAHRTSFPVDWVTGFLVGSDRILPWISTLFWQPSRAILFFWATGILLIWAGALQAMAISSIYRRKCTLSQSLDYIVWSGIVLLGFLPLGIVASTLFSQSTDWLINSLIVLLVLWSAFRLISVFQNHIRRSMPVVVLLWLSPTALLIIIALIGLDWFRAIFDYWNFIFGTIVK